MENGKSKYAQKLQERRRLARNLRLRRNATWPEIWAKQDEEEEKSVELKKSGD